MEHNKYMVAQPAAAGTVHFVARPTCKRYEAAPKSCARFK